jgi:hypothetical protein
MFTKIGVTKTIFVSHKKNNDQFSGIWYPKCGESLRIQDDPF